MIRRSIGMTLVVSCLLIHAGRLEASDRVPLESGRLYLAAGVMDTSKLDNLLDSLPDAFPPEKNYVLQLRGPIDHDRREDLLKAGVLLDDYLPRHAYIIRLDGVLPEELAALDFVSWLGHFHDEWKLDPTIGSRLEPYETPERIEIERLGQLKLAVTLFKGKDVQEAVRDLQAAGATIVTSHVVGGHGVIGLVLPKERLSDLAKIGAVQFVEEAAEITLRNDTNRWIVQSNIDGVFPLYDQGLRGEGQVVGIMDGRISADHCSFFDNEPIGETHRKILAYNTSRGSDVHGTHVAGIAVGDGGADDNRRGIAYAGKLVFNTIPGFSESAINSRLTLHHDQGARVHTNSWGNDGTTRYDGLARGIDVFSYEHESSLVMFAVTNRSTLRNPENAKNLIAVGASRDTPNQDSFCSGGRGPTSDGRRKPELFAPGCSTVSSVGSSCSTRGLTGTSMASPAVAGTALLTRQYYTDGFYPSGTRNSPDGFEPSGALVKATLFNAGVDMTGITGYPSDREGWGRVLADEALYFAGEIRTLIVSDVLNAGGMSTGEMHELPFEVRGPTEKLKVTLVWTDPAAAAGSGFAAVNDLDLEVVGPDGTTYLGNVFVGGESAPGGEKDDRNNVEQVHLLVPETGDWVARIRGAEVNEGRQGFAIVLSGDLVGEGGGGNQPQCEDVKRLTARCSNGGRIKGKVRFFTSEFSGRPVTFSVDDGTLEFNEIIEGRRAKFKSLCCFSGTHSVDLVRPDCPELRTTATCP